MIAAPPSWQRGTLRHLLASTYSGGTPSVDDPDNWSDEGTPFVKIGDMTGCPLIESTAQSVTDAGIKEKRLRVLAPGTLLLAMYASLGEVSTLGTPAAINQAIIALSPREEVHQPWLAYWLAHLKPGLSQFARSTTQDNLSADVIRSLPVVVPSDGWQHLIADFLDRETHRIDALVEAKRKLIDLLAEKRTALITQTVTRGLDPSVPMKDSGSPWVGLVPSHWLVTALRRIARVRYGLGQPPPTSATGIPIIRATNIDRGRVTERDMIFANLDDIPLDRAPLLSTGEILVVRSGANTGDSAVVPPEYDGAAAPGYDLRVTVEEANSDYVGWYLLSTSGLGQIEIQRSRAAQPHLNAEELGDLAIPLPPDTEQQAIASHLRSLTGHLSAVDESLSRQLTLLAEYRQALITAAVTGQLDEETLKGRRTAEEAMGFEVPA